MNEDHVYDLGWLEANFKSNSNKDCVVIKIGEYHHVFGSKGECLTFNNQFDVDLDSFIPLPHAKPHKFVVLKTVNGDKVRCEFKPSHIGRYSQEKYMVFDNPNYGTVFICKRGVVSISDLKLYEPILPPATPKQQLLAKIEEIITEHSQTHKVGLDKFSELKQLAEAMDD